MTFALDWQLAKSSDVLRVLVLLPEIIDLKDLYARDQQESIRYTLKSLICTDPSSAKQSSMTFSRRIFHKVGFMPSIEQDDAHVVAPMIKKRELERDVEWSSMDAQGQLLNVAGSLWGVIEAIVQNGLRPRAVIYEKLMDRELDDAVYEQRPSFKLDQMRLAELSELSSDLDTASQNDLQENQEHSFKVLWLNEASITNIENAETPLHTKIFDNQN